MRFITAAVAVALVGAAVHVDAQQVLSGSWTAHFHKADRANLNITITSAGRGTSSWGRDVMLSELAGLTRPASGRGEVRFAIDREAGQLRFEGRGDAGSAGGWFEFTPSSRYTAELRRLGYEVPKLRDLFAFAYMDVGIADIQELDRVLADDLTMDGQARAHGASRRVAGVRSRPRRTRFPRAFVNGGNARKGPWRHPPLHP
jgi:hypothetical protein